MKFTFISSFLFVLSLGNLFAQLNESDTVKFQVRTSLSGNYQKGNLEVLAIRSKFDLLAGSNKNLVFKTQNASLYQSFYSKKADNDLFSRNFLYWKPGNRIYPFAIAFISSNFRRKIDFRYFAGLGGTFQVINNLNNGLKISAGTVYEQTNFAFSSYNFETYNGSKNLDVLRVTTYLGGWHSILQKKVKLFYDGFWQPAINKSNDYRWQADIGFELPFWKGLSLTALYTFAHENVVVKNIKQDDQFLTFGFSYNFRKIK